MSKNRLENLNLLEMEILGTIIVQSKSRKILYELLAIERFRSPSHGYIFQCCTELSQLRNEWDIAHLQRHIVSKGSDAQTTAHLLDNIQEHFCIVGSERSMVEELTRLTQEEELAKLGQQISNDPEEVDYDRVIEVANVVKKVSKPYVYTGEEARKLAFLPPPTAILSGLLYRGHVSVLAAPPYSGKSWFALNIATAIASKDEARVPAPWPGAVCDATGTKVVYLSPDFPASELARRIRKLDSLRRDLVRADSYWDNLYLVGDSPGIVMPRGVYDLSNEGVVRILDDLVPAETSLLIIDTLSASLPDGVTENDNAGMAKVMGNLQKIASRRNVAVLLIHHTAKPTQGKSEIEVWSSVRGAGAISGSASCNILLEQLEDPTHANLRRLRSVSNVAVSMPTTHFEIRPMDHMADEILYWRPVPDPDQSDIDSFVGTVPQEMMDDDKWYDLSELTDVILQRTAIPTWERAKPVAIWAVDNWQSNGVIDKRKKGRAWEIRSRALD